MTLVKSLYNFMDLNRKYFVLLVYTFFFLRHKFSDRKIVHGVLVTKSVAKRHHGAESPLVISGWIFFYCSRGEHVSVSSFESKNVFFYFFESRLLTSSYICHGRIAFCHTLLRHNVARRGLNPTPKHLLSFYFCIGKKKPRGRPKRSTNMKNSDEDDESWIPGFKSGNLVCVRHLRIQIRKILKSDSIQWIQFQRGRNGPPKFEKIPVLKS
jgi:hypothetical protein